MKKYSFRYGGIIPPIAQDLHRKNIERVVADCLATSNLTVSDLDAIAVTNRPGLTLSLLVGLRYAKHLARSHSKPLIPIHHMEAHATMARISQPVKYPFLCLLASGGHCLLTFVRGPNDFLLLGESLDDAPGEAFDKVSRRLKLRNIPHFEWVSGGQAIEMAAREAIDPDRFEFPLPLARQRNCQFSFAGLKNTARRHIDQSEQVNGLGPDAVIPHYQDFCASFLRSCTRHICHRTQRAMEYCEQQGLFAEGDEKAIVFSGGVACNDFIFGAVRELAGELGFVARRPERRHCTDNGLMIAWNGVEQWLANEGQIKAMDMDEIESFPRCPLGRNVTKELEEASIGCKWVKLKAYRASNACVEEVSAV